MEMIFNELSTAPLASNKTEAFKRVDDFLQTVKRAKELNYNIIRLHEYFGDIVLCPEFLFEDYCKDPQNRTKSTLLRGLFKYPFIDENSEEESQYILNSYYLLKDGKSLETYGIASAYLYSTLAIGFASDIFWGNWNFDLEIRGDNILNEKVYCCSKKQHFDELEIKKFIEEKAPIILIESNIPPDKKSISLRDDHGKDKLEIFAKRLRNSSYVESIINSLPYNSSEINFIRKITPEGLIEIVLTNSDNGLGLVVKSTGRNIRETKAIADILEKKFKP